ncbi:hypothetical protein AX16_004267 [Volvariella volvacea WC 439]|nr:hypothetical protein AX16_004267 [Volvariella volvacea WC 439]
MDRYSYLFPPSTSTTYYAPQQRTSFFDHSNIHSTASTFITTSGTSTVVYNNHTPRSVDNRAREMLRAFVVRDAMHTGNVRADPLQVHPSTRQAIIQDIIAWIEDIGRAHYVLWLRGPAGIGKSAIAKAIADQLDRRRSTAKVAGSFFFFKGDPKRNNLSGFILTLAYRLAVTFEDVGREIDRVVYSDPEVLYASLEAQWRELVIEPVMATPSISPAVFIIDGLDECGNEKDQRRLLDFIIAFNYFDADPLHSLRRPTIDLAHHKNDREMGLFIRSSFSLIYTKHRDILNAYLTRGIWPPEHVIELITTRADGQYIYPATIFKYIDDDYTNPHERLKVCLQQAPEALSSLDALYLQILQSSHSPEDSQMEDLLFLIITSTLLESSKSKDFANLPTERQAYSIIRDLATITDLDPGQCRLKLRRLHSLIDIRHRDEDGTSLQHQSSDNDEVSLHHLSFVDFLIDPARSHQYYLDKNHCAMRVIERCLSMLDQEEFIEIESVLRWWWCSSRLLSHLSVSPTLVSRMENLDFERILKQISVSTYPLRGADGLHGQYSLFVRACRNWVVRGREEPEPEIAELWRKSTLIDKFPLHSLYVAGLAHQVDALYSRLGKQSGASGHSGAWPLSWKGLLALAECYYWNRGVQYIDMEMWASEAVLATLRIFTQDGLSQQMLEGDIQYLCAWSRPWTSRSESDLHSEHTLGSGAPQGRYSEPPRLPSSTIVNALRGLPEKHHYHELNRYAVLRWLKVISDYLDVKDLVEHWKRDECNGNTENSGYGTRSLAYMATTNGQHFEMLVYD